MSLSARELDERLSSLEELLMHLETDLKELQEALKVEDISIIDTAKGNMALSYAMILTTYAYLQVKGCPKDHPIYQDLNRVKSYMNKVKLAEGKTFETSTSGNSYYPADSRL